MKKSPVDIAVVGMSCIFPKAPDIGHFLDNLQKRRSGIVTVPETRWKVPVHQFLSHTAKPDKAVSNKAGIIENFSFNADGFALDKDILLTLDPVHQLVLQAGRQAFSQCRHTKEQKKNTGVIIAAISLPTDTSNAVSKQILFDPEFQHARAIDFSRAGMLSLPATILCRAMGFEAGAFTLDAACASSLFAIKLACEHLASGKADIMVAGGVSRPDCLYTQIGFSQLAALSPSGRCAPFDRDADGLVVGEGTGIVVLKRLEDAVAGKDNILGVIKGFGVSNDIEGTLVGPASEGQIRAMEQAYDRAGWSLADIQVMECHGSGTPVGDQVELSSIKMMMDRFSCPDTSLSIGSVKSMTGHLLTAAGAAGFIKTLLAMNNQFLAPSLNYRSPSSNSILNHTNIRVQSEVEDWHPAAPGETRKAGISAFGFGGINAHILVEEFKEDSRQYHLGTPEPQPEALPVPCAIVGMGVMAADCNNISGFADLIFNHKTAGTRSPDQRHRTSPGHGAGQLPGRYINEFNTWVGEFHIPPNQIPDILPQHLILLKSVKAALQDAGIPMRPAPGAPVRDRFGCAIGIEFDYGATDFRMRWDICQMPESIQDQVSAPLTFNRTLGALGGIVASRVAREFKLGGPCFTLSAGAVSGVKSIDTAIQSLSSNETDTFICGCVDLNGDLRQIELNYAAGLISDTHSPAEGAAAIVLKRLDSALTDKDRIYGIVNGTAEASGAQVPGESGYRPGSCQHVYETSVLSLLDQAQTKGLDIGLVEVNAAGTPHYGTDIAKVTGSIMAKDDDLLADCRFSSAANQLGHTGAAAAMFSIVKTALCMYHQRMPADAVPLNQELSDLDQAQTGDVSWPSDNNNDLKTAGIFTSAADGAMAHLLLTPPTTNQQSSHLSSTIINQPEEPSRKEICIQTSPGKLSEQDLQQIRTHLFGLPRAARMQETVLLPDPMLLAKGAEATAQAHKKFLDFTEKTMQEYGKQFEALTKIAGRLTNESLQDPSLSMPETTAVDKTPAQEKNSQPTPLFNRQQCLEYAVGSAGNVLGKDFDIIDTYPVRVRLPDEPLMLVDRIMSIEGEMLSLTKGKIVTQHDVKEGAWYLDGNKAPVCISIEAGQADLFLCAYLGIDHQVKGKRKYRLLDARVTFHRSLPIPGETIEYHIEIDRFLKQGDVFLFFFHYKGYIGNQLLISMRNGCAGFFTDQEVMQSGGIILKKEDKSKHLLPSTAAPLVPVEKHSLSDSQVEALRSGNLEKAFGTRFSGITLGRYLCLPGGQMHLIDRVLELDPKGGRFGLGSIVAQADIHPDDWFLTCHFVDDMVMPGTLMYECCAHALRIFTQRFGWISSRDDVCYDVVLQNESDLKCRGPVTPETKTARYEIEIKEMGYGPEPYVIADAHMFSDDLRIVLYKDMGMKLTGLTEDELEGFWRDK